MLLHLQFPKYQPEKYPCAAKKGQVPGLEIFNGQILHYSLYQFAVQEARVDEPGMQLVKSHLLFIFGNRWVAALENTYRLGCRPGNPGLSLQPYYRRSVKGLTPDTTSHRALAGG